MEIVLLIARLFLASILVIAGVAKATDQVGARKALIGFGVPEEFAGLLAWCLPFIEITVALALIPLSTAWIGAISALALMLIFSVAIGLSILRGRKTECNCFGQLHSRPVSWSMFARNLILAAVAALIVLRGREAPGLSALAWVRDLKTAETMNLLISSFAVGLLVTGVVYLRRVLNQQTRILDRIDEVEKLVEEFAPPPVEREEAMLPPEGLPVGARAPDFSLASIGGGQISLRNLLGYGKPVLLLFVSPNCAPCATILQDVSGWERDYSDRLTIAVLSKGSLLDNERRVAKHGVRHLLLVGESDVVETYKGKWSPSAVLISPRGRLASHNTYGEQAIRELINFVVAAIGSTPRGDKLTEWDQNALEIIVGKSPLKVGDKAPDFSLPDMDGEPVAMKDLLGRDTLLLFWSPSCPFCTAMSEDVRRWEENPPPDAPRLVFVTSGDLEAVREASEGFESLFLHDDGFQVGILFGTRSTPSALLIDSEGRIASSIGSGSSNVLLLAGVSKVVAPVVSSSS
jgi:peroxiredoxin/uncharacterized membrane protein YphA (DoxX/SURF4 family)